MENNINEKTLEEKINIIKNDVDNIYYVNANGIMSIPFDEFKNKNVDEIRQIFNRNLDTLITAASKMKTDKWINDYGMSRALEIIYANASDVVDSKYKDKLKNYEEMYNNIVNANKSLMQENENLRKANESLRQQQKSNEIVDMGGGISSQVLSTSKEFTLSEGTRSKDISQNGRKRMGSEQEFTFGEFTI